MFDPAMCCSTGVCGPDVDPQLVHFSADLDWLKSRGVEVRRHNLAHEPAAFVANTIIKDVLQHQGVAALPAVVINGQLVSTGCYPSRQDLARAAHIYPAVEPGHVSVASAQTDCGCSTQGSSVKVNINTKKDRGCCGT
ncbi:MAG: arsenite efflux transporter metallochaperone ArsD [Phycisphaerales bacterium]|nr:arsenite efflux transporter metallochaperone ArsD [Phycisphaerales bacterium]